MDGVDRSEGAGIIVGHHTHFEHGIVGSAGSFGPEHQLQRIDEKGIGVDHRQGNSLVAAVGSSGGRDIPIEAHVATGSVVVGSGAREVGVKIGSGIGKTAPAGNEYSRATGG